METKYKVYIHYFPNGKRYIGLTTQNLKKRWKGGSGYRTQPLVYRAILKYGWKNVVHQVFECETESEMKYLEKYLIAYYQTTNPKYGYNITEGGEGVLGLIPKNRKPIEQYNKNGQLIRTWDSIQSIEKELNYKAACIASCARGERPTAYNFYWCYVGQLPVFKTYGTWRTIYQFDLKGNLIGEYKSAQEAARNLGRSASPITDCCNKKCKTAFGFYWSYSSTPEINLYKARRKVLQYDLNGNFIKEYKSAADAGRSIGKCVSPIIACCNKKQKTAHNFIWRYENNNLS